MLMQYHWGLGVGHAYAHSSTKPTSETQSTDSSEDAPDTRPIVGDDSDDYSSLESSSDLDESEPGDFDDEIAAMYGRNSQDEDEDGYQF